MMVITYYTLFLLLFDSMIEARVDSSASYRKKISKHCRHLTCRHDPVLGEDFEGYWDPGYSQRRSTEYCVHGVGCQE